MRRIPLPFVFVFAALACGDPPAAPSRRPPAKLSFGMDEPPRPPPFPPLAADPPAAKAVPVAASTPAPVATPAPTVPPAPAPLPVLKAKKASEATMMIVVEAPKELVEALNTLATDTKAPPWIKTAKEQISLQASSGSGFALTVESAAGSWVATNAHVTEGGWTHIARMPDRPQPFSLEAAFVDRNNDIAILKSVERIPGLPLAEKIPRTASPSTRRASQG